MEDKDFSSSVVGLMQQQIAVKRERKAKADAAAAAARRRGVLISIVSLLVMIGSAWLMYDRLQPPGFVRVFDVNEESGSGRTVVKGKVKNMTQHTIERTWLISYYEDKAKKPATEVELVVKDLKSGEIRDWSLEVPGWKPGLRRIVHRKDGGG